MPSNKQIFDTKMNALADSINEKAETYGAKDLDELKAAVDGISVGIDTSDADATSSDILYGKTAYVDGVQITGDIVSQYAQTVTPTDHDQTVIYAGTYAEGDQTVEAVVCENLTAENIKDGVTVKIGCATDDDSVAEVTGTYSGGSFIKPPYLISDRDTVTTLYFNKDYAGMSAFFPSLTNWFTDYDTGFDVCILGFTNPTSGLNHLFAVDLGGGAYGLVWNDGVTVTPIYTTVAVPAYGITAAGWQTGSFSPASAVTVDTDHVDPNFLSVMDSMMAKSSVAFGDHGGGSGKAHTFQAPEITGSYTYNGSVQNAAISGYYGDFMTKTGDMYAINAGSYSVTFTLTDTANCQWSDGTTAPKTVPWSIAKAALPTPALSKTSIVLQTGAASDTFTVIRPGSGAVSAVSSDPTSITASVSGTTVTVTAHDTTVDSSATITVTVAEDTNYYAYTATDVTATATVSTGYVQATVSGLGSASPANVTFTVDPGFTIARLGIGEVNMGGDTFISFPTMYRKVNSVYNGQITSFTIANGPVDSSFEPYSVFIAEDGVTVLPYVLLGKYATSSAAGMESVSNTNWQRMTIQDGRTYARQRGTGYQQFDWQFQKLWQDLIIVFSQTVNINPGQHLTTDLFGIYWSGMGGCLVDGIWSNSGSIVFSYKPSKYVNAPTANTDGYKSVPYNGNYVTGSNEVKKLGYNASDPFINIPTDVISNNSYNTYYCDDCYFTENSVPISYVYSTNTSAKYGAFHFGIGDVVTVKKFVRLCYRPISS